MSQGAAIAVVMAGLTVAGVYGVLRHHTNPYREKRKRGMEPGQGDTLVYAQERMPFGVGNEDAAGRVTRVTRDPQIYARGMMPGKARQDRNT